MSWRFSATCALSAACLAVAGCGRAPSERPSESTALERSPEIHDVQGEGRESPYIGRSVTVRGVVTAADDRGFFLQGLDPDDDPRTSEGLYVLGRSAAPGNRLRVTGTVLEAVEDDSDLPLTTLVVDHLRGDQAVLLEADVAELPAPAAVESAPTSRAEAIDRWEALEGMRVRLPRARVSGPTDRYGEIAVVPGDRPAPPLTAAGGLLVDEERPGWETLLLSPRFSALPAASVGDRIVGVEGVLGYRYGAYRLLVLDSGELTPSAQADPEPMPAVADDALRVATFNVENLSLADEPERFERLAERIVATLGAPDLLGLQEIQDDSGPTDDGVVSARETLARLTDTLERRGVSYSAHEIAPEDGRDGGRPGANIRVALLVRGGRGLALVPPEAGEPNPIRLDPADPAFAESRKALLSTLRWRGRRLHLLVCHLNSKRSDDPLLGAQDPPRRGSERQRHAQVRSIAQWLDTARSADPDALFVVLGDLNDGYDSETLRLLRAAGLEHGLDRLPAEQRYSHVYRGRAALLDHVLASPELEAVGQRVLHLHADRPAAGRLSDHDPVVVDYRLTP